MAKERVSREVKLKRMEEDWYYSRSGMDEKRLNQTTVKEPTVLFDEGAIRRGWTSNRFGVEE